MTESTHTPLTDFLSYPVQEGRIRAQAFHQAMRRRHTIRQFSDRAVDLATIDAAIAAAGTAPSGANHQPWHFSVLTSPDIKSRVRMAAEAEEREFYGGRAGDAWLDALAPLGTDAHKPFLETAPVLISIFAQRRGGATEGEDKKNYYITESVGIATGMLITALHLAGLATLTHTPAPMGFLTEICQRPSTEKPFLLLVVGYPADDATVPTHALQKKPLDAIRSVL